MTIGFSTGSLAFGNFRLALANMSHVNVNAVELSALRESELLALVDDLDTLDLKKFRYISFHAPSRIESFSELELVQILKYISARHWPIIVHPDLIHDFEIWRCLGSSLCIENMDKRKSCGRTSVSLKKIFNDLPEATFCFDIAHALQVDPTMRDSVMMLKTYGNRLRQIHISTVNSRSAHEALNVESMISFKSLVKYIPHEIPIIIESPISKQDMELEIKKVNLIFEENQLEHYLLRSVNKYSHTL